MCIRDSVMAVLELWACPTSGATILGVLLRPMRAAPSMQDDGDNAFESAVLITETEVIQDLS